MKIQIDTREIRQFADQLAKFGREELAKGIGIGMGKIGRTGVAESKREIRGRYNVKAGRVSRALSIVRPGKFEVVVKASDNRGIQLTDMPGTRSGKKGVRFSVIKGKREILRHAFGRKNKIFTRAKKSVKRYPIKLVRSLGVATMFGSYGVRPKVVSHINSKGSKILTHEIKQAIIRAGLKK